MLLWLLSDLHNVNKFVYMHLYTWLFIFICFSAMTILLGIIFIFHFMLCLLLTNILPLWVCVWGMLARWVLFLFIHVSMPSLCCLQMLWADLLLITLWFCLGDLTAHGFCTACLCCIIFWPNISAISQATCISLTFPSPILEAWLWLNDVSVVVFMDYSLGA